MTFLPLELPDQLSAQLPAWCVAAASAAGSLLLSDVLARWARRAGWTDRVFAGERGRKDSASGAPLVGGLAILAALVLARLVGGEALALGRGTPFGERDVWRALAAAFALGTWDDRAGLAPRVKLAGQVAVGVVLVAPAMIDGSLGALALAWIAGVVVAQNALNTYDNADGAASSLAAGALLGPAPLAAAAIAGFLPANLGATRAERRPPILGDAGSHLLGVLLLAHPGAWPALALPLADLARVAVVRLRRGGSPFVGDRRHLAHRLALGGLGRLGVAGALLVVAAPSLLAAMRSGEHAPLDALAVAGLLGTLALFAVAVRATPDPDRGVLAPVAAAPRNAQSEAPRADATPEVTQEATAGARAAAPPVARPASRRPVSTAP